MFGRLKQRVKEKTGRAKATTLPADVQEAVEYFKELTGRLNDLHKNLKDLNDYYKIFKKSDFAAGFINISRLPGVKTDEIVETYKKAEEAETKYGQKIASNVDYVREWSKTEGKARSDAVSGLTKARLDMDIAAGTEDETRISATTESYNSALNKIRGYYSTAKTEEVLYTSYVVNIVKDIKATYKK